MANKNRKNVQTVSPSTQAASDLRKGVDTLPMVANDAQLNAVIDESKSDGADVVVANNFKAQDDQAKKGPYATEAEARKPENVYKNGGPKQWELVEVTLPEGILNPVTGNTVLSPSADDKVYVWEVNLTHAIALVARRMGFDAGKAGAKAVRSSELNRLKDEKAELQRQLDEMKKKLGIV